jgi:hypothetical protein
VPGVGIRGTEWDRGRWRRRGTLVYQATTGPVLPVFFPNSGYLPFVVSVEGVFTGLVRVLASNAEDRPPDGSAPLGFPQLGPDFAGAAGYELASPWDWLAVWIPTVGTLAGSVSVYLNGALRNE